MKQKGIWLRKGLALYHLAPSELALALLVLNVAVVLLLEPCSSRVIPENS